MGGLVFFSHTLTLTQEDKKGVFQNVLKIGFFLLLLLSGKQTLHDLKVDASRFSLQFGFGHPPRRLVVKINVLDIDVWKREDGLDGMQVAIFACHCESGVSFLVG
mgnify:CR=1 FL=1